jgi:hypothetical protein
MADDRSSKPGSLAWRGRTPTDAAKQPAGRASRWRRFVTLAACALGLAGVLIGLGLLLRPYDPPFLLTIPIAEYRESALPINAFAVQDSDAIKSYFPNHLQPLDNQQRDRLVRALDKLHDRHEKSVVVYLSTLAVARGNAVYLLPVEADPFHPEGGLPLDDVLRYVKACPAGKKLLVLDIMGQFADPNLGLLDNDVAKATKAAVERNDDPNLVVLTPCSPGEVALPAEEMRQSAFGYFFQRGLAGDANGAGADGKLDQFITVHELAAYLKNHVSQWARLNRSAEQMPLLLGKGSDFKLSLVSKEKPAEPEASDQVPTCPPWLADGWHQRDQAEGQSQFRVTPQVFAAIEADLLRANARWRAGGKVDKIKSALADALGRHEAELKATQGEIAPVDAPSPFQLALTPDAALGVDADIAKDFTTLAATASPDPKKAADAAKAIDDFCKKYKAKPPERFAWTIFDQIAIDSAPTLTKIRMASVVIDKLKLPRQYAETILLRRLAAQNIPDSAGAKVHDLLASLREEGRILAADPRAIAGFYDRLTAAAKKRVDAEKAFFNPDDATASDADGVSSSALFDAYHAIGADIEPLDRAYRLCDQARAELPGYVPYLLARPSTDDSPDQAWYHAVQDIVDIDGLLVAPPNSPDAAERMQRMRRPFMELNDLRDNLASPFAAAEIAALAKREGADQLSAYLKLNARLAGARYQVADRSAAWQAADHLGQALWQRMQDVESGKRAASPALALVRGRGPWDAGQIKRRAHMAIALLNLAHSPAVPELEATLAHADPAWPILGQQLRKALERERNDLPTRLSEERSAYRTARQALWQWLGKRYQSEYDALPAGDTNRRYFKEAAGEYLRGS